MGYNNRLSIVENMSRQLLDVVGEANLITYNHKATNHGSVRKIQYLHADGGTSFIAALQGLLKVLLVTEGPTQVVFLTDGESQDQQDTSQQYLRTFAAALTDRQVSIHAMGVDSDAHTEFLLSITQAGPIPGTFGYLNTSTNHKEAVSREFNRLRDVVSIGQQITFRGQTYLVTEPEFSVYLQDNSMDSADPSTIDDEIDYFAYVVGQQALNASTVKLSDVIKLQDRANELYRKTGKIDRVIRKSLRTRLGEINTIITNWYALLNQQTTLSNEQLAILNVAARDARSDRFLKVAVKRTHNNAEIIIKEDQAIQEAIPLCRQHPTNLTLSCTISQLSVDELLEEGDCLGVGISALSKEVCLMDSTRLVVENISTSYYGSDAFLDLAVWAGKLQTVKFGTVNTLTTDEGRRPVSGVLPLYLNDTHWSVAKHYVRRMVGHLTCLDPLLATNSTVFYTYLLAYLKCRTLNNDKHQAIAAQLLETMHHIPSMLPTPQVFFSQVDQRSPVVVPNLRLLKEWFGIPNPSWNNDEIPPWNLIMEYMAEEQDRRDDRFQGNSNISTYLDYDYQQWIRPHVTANLHYPNYGIGSHELRQYLCDHYPDAKYSTTSQASSSSVSAVVVPDVGSYVPILSKFARDNKMDSKAILMALQLARYPNSQEFIDHYQDYISISVNDKHKIEEELLKLAHQQLELLRVKALTAAQNLIDKNALAGVLNHLRMTPDTLTWTLATFNYCYSGRNIINFAKIASTPDHIRMLFTGKFDIAPLLDLNSPVIIPTVRDMKLRKSLSPAYYKLPQMNVEGYWLPKISDLRRMINKYGLELILEIFPKTIHFLIHAINH